MGGATKGLSPEVRETYAELPWKNMAGLRDKLIHDYFGVNNDIVWQIVTEELSGVANQIENILRAKNE